MMFIGSAGLGRLNGGGWLPARRNSSYSTTGTAAGAGPSPRCTSISRLAAASGCSATRSASEPSTISTRAPE